MLRFFSALLLGVDSVETDRLDLAGVRLRALAGDEVGVLGVIDTLGTGCDAVVVAGPAALPDDAGIYFMVVP